MISLIVVDAWKNCEKEDLIQFPWLEYETKLFGKYLNLHLTLIKEKFDIDIYYIDSGRAIMDEIDTTNGTIVNDISNIEEKYDYYYFCGFHLGRCINKKLLELNNNNSGIVINLSLIFPSDTYKKNSKINSTANYMYSYEKGFECIDMKI